MVPFRDKATLVAIGGCDVRHIPESSGLNPA
jgi:hypothetical protein